MNHYEIIDVYQVVHREGEWVEYVPENRRTWYYDDFKKMISDHEESLEGLEERAFDKSNTLRVGEFFDSYTIHKRKALRDSEGTLFLVSEEPLFIGIKTGDKDREDNVW